MFDRRAICPKLGDQDFSKMSNSGAERGGRGGWGGGGCRGSCSNGNCT